jgi:hypothetical protein
MSKRLFLDDAPIAGSTVSIDVSTTITGDVALSGSLIYTRASFATDVFVTSLSSVNVKSDKFTNASFTHLSGLFFSDEMTANRFNCSRLSVSLAGGGAIPPNRVIVNSLSVNVLDLLYASASVCIGGPTAPVTISNTLSLTDLRALTVVSTITNVGVLTTTDLVCNESCAISVSTLSAGNIGTAISTRALTKTVTSISDVGNTSAVFDTLIEFLSTTTRLIDGTTAQSTFSVLIDGTYELSGLMTLLLGDGTIFPRFAWYTSYDEVSLNLYVNDVLVRQLAAQNFYTQNTSNSVMVPFYYVGTFSALDDIYMKCTYARSSAFAQLRALVTRSYQNTTTPTVSQMSFIRLGPKV